jgi:hypothetical protein
MTTNLEEKVSEKANYRKGGKKTRGFTLLV